MSRLTYDLTDPQDRLTLGLALDQLTATAAWAGLEDVRRHLEQRFIDRMGKDTQAGLLARLLARLTGDAVAKQAPIGAEDFARLQGQREGMHALLDEVSALILEARRATEAPAPTNVREVAQAQRLPLGRSPL